jgi:hypothetical protein
MDVNSFCGLMQSEITSLQARVYDIMQAVEKIKDKKKRAEIEQLMNVQPLLAQLSEMNDRLAKECPLDWTKEQRAIEAKKTELVKKIDMWDSEHLAGLVDN